MKLDLLFGSTEEEVDINFSESYMLPSDVIKTDETLSFKNGILSVNTSKKVEDSILPVTSAAVDTVVGNIDILLKTI